jgi:chemotaxis protein MotB
MRFVRPLVLLAFLAASGGCVSSSRFDDMKEENRELKWKLDAAERVCQKAENDKVLAQRELRLAREDFKIEQEKLALSDNALNRTKAQMDEELKARLEELQSKAPGKHELSPWGGVVLETGILFASGQHQLTKEGEAALAPLVEALSGPKYQDYVVEIAGHTDSDPVVHAKKYDDNFDLGAKRANSVRRFLGAHGVADTKTFLSSWGDTHPLDGKDKAANRRVEIQLHHIGGTTELPAAARPDTTTPATAKPEVTDDAKPEMIDPDTAKTPEPEASKPAEPEPTKQEAPKPEAPKPETPKSK